MCPNSFHELKVNKDLPLGFTDFSHALKPEFNTFGTVYKSTDDSSALSFYSENIIASYNDSFFINTKYIIDKNSEEPPSEILSSKIIEINNIKYYNRIYNYRFDKAFYKNVLEKKSQQGTVLEPYNLKYGKYCYELISVIDNHPLIFYYISLKDKNADSTFQIAELIARSIKFHIKK